MPALLTRMAIGPLSRSMPATAWSTAASSVTSKAQAPTFRPSAASTCLAASSLAVSRPFRITCAPAAARPRAKANPIPWLDPVTSARRPSSLNSSSPIVPNSSTAGRLDPYGHEDYHVIDNMLKAVSCGHESRRHSQGKRPPHRRAGGRGTGPGPGAGGHPARRHLRVRSSLLSPRRLRRHPPAGADGAGP